MNEKCNQECERNQECAIIMKFYRRNCNTNNISINYIV